MPQPPTERVYYNEFAPDAAEYLENLIAERLIPAGVVDRRSISDVDPRDLDGFIQCHFFAGIGGWPLAAELAGYPADWPLWTGSCPCQPFSLAGEKLGADDDRHLWPDFFRLIDARRPPVVVGEQVAGALGYGWLDGVRADLGTADYASRSVDIPAAAMDSPQIRQRLYWAALDMACANSGGLRALGRDLGQGAGHQPGASRPDHDPALPGGRDEASARGVLPVEHPSGLGRGEGRAEHGVRSRGNPAAGADVEGRGRGPVAHGDRQHGREHLALGGPEGRTAAPGDDAGERPGVAQGDTEEFGRGAGLRQAGPLGHGIEPADPDGASGDHRGAAQGRASGGRLAVGEQPGGLGGDEGRWGDAPRANVPNGSWWADHRWIICHDEKARRIPEPGVPLLVTGVSGALAVLRSGEVVERVEEGQEVRRVSRVAAWRGAGNAINPVLAAEVLKALLDG